MDAQIWNESYSMWIDGVHGEVVKGAHHRLEQSLVDWWRSSQYRMLNEEVYELVLKWFPTDYM